MKLVNFNFLSQDYPVDKAFFVVPKKLLLWTGIWPFSQLTFAIICFDIFNAVSLGIGGFSEYAFVFTHLNEPLKALDCVCPASSVTVTFFKYIYLVYYRGEFRDCINRCKELFFAGELESRKRKRINTLNIDKYFFVS